MTRVGPAGVCGADAGRVESYRETGSMLTAGGTCSDTHPKGERPAQSSCSRYRGSGRSPKTTIRLRRARAAGKCGSSSG